MSYEYICPSCGKKVILKQESTYREYVEKQKLCSYCRQKEKDLKSNLTRICPKCGVEIHYKHRSDYLKANRNDSCCLKCLENSGRFTSGILKYNSPKNTPTFSLLNLLDGNLNSFYWLGLIIADGSFYGGSFEISLQENDYGYLCKFAKYISFDLTKIVYRNKTKSYRINFSNQNSIKKIMSIFGIQYKKTYNPIDYDAFFKKYTMEQKTAFLIGIIDGDGCITKISKTRYTINITAHYNWEFFYKKLLDDINLDFNIRRINNSNVIRVATGKQYNVRKLLSFIKNNNLTYFERKWDKIIY